MLWKEWTLELRKKHALFGVVVYVLAAVYVCYLSLEEVVEIELWAALFWISALFASFNAMQRAFLAETGGQALYLYTLASPRSIVLSKSVYNALQLAFLNVLSLVFFVLFFWYRSLGRGRLDAAFARLGHWGIRARSGPHLYQCAGFQNRWQFRVVGGAGFPGVGSLAHHPCEIHPAGTAGCTILRQRLSSAGIGSVVRDVGSVVHGAFPVFVAGLTRRPRNTYYGLQCSQYMGSAHSLSLAGRCSSCRHHRQRCMAVMLSLVGVRHHSQGSPANVSTMPKPAPRH
jgi:hypothetical protein